MKITIDLPKAIIDRAKEKDGKKLCDIDIKFICMQIANCDCEKEEPKNEICNNQSK